MNILVCAKQVPNTNEVKIDPVKGTLIREGVESILNPDDANALEEALRLKDQYEDVKVTVLSMGPPQADDMLRECLPWGRMKLFSSATGLLAAPIPGQPQTPFPRRSKKRAALISSLPGVRRSMETPRR